MSYTSLNTTVAYAMLRAAGIARSSGHIVCDPMCGGGTIAETGACADEFKSCFYINGDSSRVAVEKSHWNCHTSRRLLVDTVQWDASRLPLRPQVVDHFVTDLPFGKRMGNKHINRSLYASAVGSISEVLRPNGRLVLLSADRHHLTLAVRHGSQ